VDGRWVRLLLLLSVGLSFAGRQASAQVYGYTDEKGVLILSNVPTDSRMRLIAEGNPEAAGRVWRYSGQYDALIFKEANLAGLDSALVKAVIAVESGFNRFARSHAGAMGLMQLMPATCDRYGVANPYDARQNVRAGSRHLRVLLDEFKDVRLSLAAYNAGETPVRRLRRVPPYRETQGYVRKVMAIYQVGSKISITKGGRIYSMGPGGNTRVQSKPATAKGDSAGTATRLSKAPEKSEQSRNKASLTELAASSRRSNEVTPGDGGRSDAATGAPETATMPSQEASPIEETGSKDGALYYRYTDSNGVIYITREKPPHPFYEVLQP
jgi:soluble lytic murein transglycosylase